MRPPKPGFSGIIQLMFQAKSAERTAFRNELAGFLAKKLEGTVTNPLFK